MTDRPVPLWQDGALAIFNKPHGVPVDSAGGATFLDQVGAPHACHRLDAVTGGALLVAFDREAAAWGSALFAERRVKKFYLALCAGVPVEAAMSLHGALAKRGERAVVQAGAQQARTEATVLARGRDAALWLAVPDTGRYHQLRAHLADAGHPVVGDWRYGEHKDLCVGLHCAALVFPHPRTGAPLRVVAPPQPVFFRLATRHGLADGWWEPAAARLQP